MTGFDPRALVRALAASGARYAIIGGVAVGLYGNPRATFDLDVIVPADADNRSLIVAALAGRFDDPDRARRWIEDGGNARLETDLGVLDLLEEGEGDLSWESIAADIEQRAAEDGTAVALCGLRTLVSLKRLADRPLDRADLAALEEIHGEL